MNSFIKKPRLLYDDCIVNIDTEKHRLHFFHHTFLAKSKWDCARNGKNLRISQGNAELVNECPHGTDIQKQNKGSALVKTIVGIEVL